MSVCVTNPILACFSLCYSAIYCFWGTTDWCGAKNKGNTLNGKECQEKDLLCSRAGEKAAPVQQTKDPLGLGE